MTDLTGAYIEIYKVTNPGGTGETETKIGRTHDTVTISPNVKDAEATLHNQVRKVRKPVQDAPEVKFNGIVTSVLQALQDLGVLPSTTGTLTTFTTTALDSVRLKVFENEGDTAPSQTWDLLSTYFKIDSIEFPADGFAAWKGVGVVNGDIQKNT